MKRIGMVVASIGTAALMAGGIAAIAAFATSPSAPEATIAAPASTQAVTGAGYARSGGTQQPAAAPAPRDNRSWGVFNALVGDEQTRARRADEQRAAAARQPTRQASGDDDDDDGDDD